MTVAIRPSTRAPTGDPRARLTNHDHSLAGDQELGSPTVAQLENVVDPAGHGDQAPFLRETRCRPERDRGWDRPAAKES